MNENHMWFVIEMQDAKQLYDEINSMIERQADSKLIKLKKSVATRN